MGLTGHALKIAQQAARSARDHLSSMMHGIVRKMQD